MRREVAVYPEMNLMGDDFDRQIDEESGGYAVQVPYGLEKVMNHAMSESSALAIVSAWTAKLNRLKK